MKQTEIGLIPDDWEVKRLGDITRIQAGGTPSTLFEAYWNGNIRWMNSGELNLKRVYEVEGRITELGLNNSSTHLIPKGCVLIGLAGQGKTRGTAAINYVDLCTNQSIAAIFPSKFHSSDFLYHVMDNKYQELRELSDGGGGRGGLNLKILNDIQIQLPPLAEQQRIAKALSDVDALISTTEKLIQKKKNIKQGTMQNLLTGKKRLPGFTKSSNYKQTEIGLIPEDWEVKSLGEIFEFRPNNTFTRDCLNDSKGKYQNVHYGDVLIKYPSILDCSKETIPFINEGINVKFSKYGIVEGDIIIADTAEDETVGKVVEVFNLGEKKIVSGLHTFLCRKITDDFAPKWLGYFMNQAIFHNQLLPFITGTKVSAISRTAIQNVKVLIPSKEEQTAIANVLSSMDKEIETLNTKLEKYHNLKTAMMQQLLTGKIRLK